MDASSMNKSTVYVEECALHEEQLCWQQQNTSKVAEETYELAAGIHVLSRDAPVIEAFLCAVPSLCQQPETFGLIWDQKLKPTSGRYEPGEHYCSISREESRKSAHGHVTFHRDGDSGEKFAIKTLLSQDIFNPEEVRIGLLKCHPNICCVYGIIIRNSQVQILLEHAGVPVMRESQWLSQSSERKLMVAQQCFQALEFLAENDLVHCDVKPDNLTLVRDGDEFVIKLVDFGSCQKSQSIVPRHTHTTMEYWAPEVWKAVNEQTPLMCDPAMDVYAMALTLYFFETSHHLTQRFEDLKAVMLTMPSMVKMIGLPDSLPADLRVIMKLCLDENSALRLTAHKAGTRFQDAIIPPSFLHESSKAINYEESMKLLMEKLAQTNDRASFFTTVEKLKDSFTSKLGLTPGSQVMQPGTVSAALTNPHPSSLCRVRPTTSLNSKGVKRPVKQFAKNKSTFKPTIKAKELKNAKSVSFKGKGKDKGNLVTDQSSNSTVTESVQNVYPISNYLKNLAMKVKHCPESDVTIDSTENMEIDQQRAVESNIEVPKKLTLSPQSDITKLHDTAEPVITSLSCIPDSSGHTSYSQEARAPTAAKSLSLHKSTKSDPDNGPSQITIDLGDKSSKADASSMEVCEDDWGFVVDVLDNNALTGEEDDIANFLYENLPDTDKFEESCARNCNTTLVEANKQPDNVKDQNNCGPVVDAVTHLGSSVVEQTPEVTSTVGHVVEAPPDGPYAVGRTVEHPLDLVNQNGQFVSQQPFQVLTEPYRVISQPSYKINQLQRVTNRSQHVVSQPYLVTNQPPQPGHVITMAFQPSSAVSQASDVVHIASSDSEDEPDCSIPDFTQI